MELTLTHNETTFSPQADFYTDDEQVLLQQLEQGVVKSKSHDQVMENLRKTLGLADK